MILNGSLSGVIFGRQELSTKLIGNKLPALQGLKLLVANLDELPFILNRKDQIDLTKDSQLSFSLSGVAEVVAQVDDVALAKKLAGVKKSDAGQVLKQFKEIGRAETVFRPPWARRFPTNPDDITVVLDVIN